MKQRHYFISNNQDESQFFKFSETFLNKTYTFTSCEDVFSKNKIDDGTKVLLNTIIENYNNLQGNVLDLGCGYGVISVILKTYYNNCQMFATDINKTAVKLCEINAKQNNVKVDVFLGNVTENVKHIEFDYVFSNPPIKAGKQVLFEFVTQSFNVLKEGGELVLVIRKDKGQESLQKHMVNIFNNCQILKRDKGYYILKSLKN